MELPDPLPEFSPRTYAAIFVTLYTLWCIQTAIYRLWFHPVAAFPGPKFAALTYWNEMYHDIFRTGNYINEIRCMHEKYGPIVRINPEELHVSDPEFYQSLYAPSLEGKGGQEEKKALKRHKWSRYVRLDGGGESGFGTTDHDLCKLRRKPLEPYFSPANVRKLQGLIVGKVDYLCQKLEETQEAQPERPVFLKYACSCFTADVISEYAFGSCFDYLSHPEFFPDWSETMSNIAKATVLLKPWPWIFTVLDNIPMWLARRMGQGIEASTISKHESRIRIEKLKAGKVVDGGRSHPTVFEEVLKSDLPEYEKSVRRLQGDGQAILAAGTETTASTLATTSVYVLADEVVYRRLKKELEGVMPDSKVLPSLQVLEKLPYLVSTSFSQEMEATLMSVRTDCCYERGSTIELWAFDSSATDL